MACWRGLMQPATIWWRRAGGNARERWKRPPVNA